MQVHHLYLFFSKVRACIRVLALHAADTGEDTVQLFEHSIHRHPIGPLASLTRKACCVGYFSRQAPF